VFEKELVDHAAICVEFPDHSRSWEHDGAMHHSGVEEFQDVKETAPRATVPCGVVDEKNPNLAPV